MKKLFALLIIIPLTLTSVFAFDIEKADELLFAGLYEESRDMLVEGFESEEKAGKTDDLANIGWRIGRACYLLGGIQKYVDGNPELADETFILGRAYCDRAKEYDRNVWQIYVWRVACYGRECKGKSMSYQLNAVDSIFEDLEIALDDLGCTNSSEGWQAIGEVYYNHPLKSTDDSINYIRAAIDTIPDDEIRVYTYRLLAEVLYKRDYSAKKRAKLLEDEQKAWKKTYSSNIEKYKNYEGSKAKGYNPVWTTKKLSEMSDREEAIYILEYAKKLYEDSKTTLPAETLGYTEINNLLAQWK